MGGKTNPTALETTYRIQRNIIQKLCEDEQFDIFELKEALQIEPLLPEEIPSTVTSALGKFSLACESKRS